MRVHELAKELRLTSKQLVSKLHELGIEVKSTLANLNDEQAAKAREALSPAPKKPSPASAAAARAAASAAAMAQTKTPSLAARRTAAIQRTRAAQPPAADARRRARMGGSAAAAVAARMKQARAKTKGAEGAPGAAAGMAMAAPPASGVPGAPVSAHAGAGVLGVPAPPAPPRARRVPAEPVVPGLPGARLVEERKGRARRKGAGREPVPPEELVLPTIEVMKIDEGRRGVAGRRRGKSRVVSKRDTPGRSRVPDEDRIAPSFVLLPLPKRPARPRAVQAPKKPAGPKIVHIEGDTTVGQFSEKTGIAAPELIKSLLTNHNQALTVNQILPPDLMELLAIEFDVEVEIIPESDEHDVQKYLIEDKEESLVPRPPVVTVMGHVDHGKTSLLDVIRQANVVEGEVGGITQHIGAYMVDTAHGRICFLDTPGHEAFTAMRARGAKVTDIVVLVVAADDPLMPQAIEAINHAREANVSILVAINKIDLPTANVHRITNDLMALNLTPETYGGDTIYCHVSAKKRIGIESLLESILLQAEMMELKANPKRRAAGIIIESRNDPLRGANCTVLVQKGTLHIGDAFVVGQQYGRLKAMFDDHGQPQKEAGPAVPVGILGLDGAPEPGEVLLGMPDERKAREIAEIRAGRRRLRGLEQRRHVTLEGLKDMVDREKVKELRVVLKADVQGSLEAVRQSLERILHEEIKIRILHGGVGGITVSDVDLADASDAVVIGFNVRPDSAAADWAQERGVEIKTYQIIYDLIDEVKAAMAGMLEKKYREIPMGRAEVRQVFRVSKLGNVAGCYVSSGEIARNGHARLLRDGVIVYNGRIANLRRYKDDVSNVAVGLECGIGLENCQDVREGDEIEFYELQEIPAEI